MTLVHRRGDEVTIVDLLDRLLGSGVVIVGDVVISIADVDLVEVSLRALVSSVRAESASQHRAQAELGEPQYVIGAELEHQPS